MGTFKYDIKVFVIYVLNLYTNCDHGNCIRFRDRRLGMVITQWERSRIIQTVSTATQKYAGIMIYRKGDDMVEVIFPHDITKYKENTDFSTEEINIG